MEAPSGTMSMELMATLQRITKDEFALMRLKDGRRILLCGQESSVVLTKLRDDIKRIIAHTHPRDVVLDPSTADYEYIWVEIRSAQRFSYIFDENGLVKKFTSRLSEKSICPQKSMV